MATGSKPDPYRGFRFRIEIDGIAVAHFSDVSGLQVETEIEPYEEGGVNDFVHQLPKRTKFQPVTLKRGITDADTLWSWHQDVVIGKFKRKNGSIILLDEAGNDKWRWNFSNAFPAKWTGPDLKADGNAVAFETIELVHNGIKKG
ncbi:MAG TPA: phage tail protein [Dissulfurispiraceae bacterium]|nr:phage tail protein [Dissulfurispiraceae bacterium]